MTFVRERLRWFNAQAIDQDIIDDYRALVMKTARPGSEAIAEEFTAHRTPSPLRPVPDLRRPAAAPLGWSIAGQRGRIGAS